VRGVAVGCAGTAPARSVPARRWPSAGDGLAPPLPVRSAEAAGDRGGVVVVSGPAWVAVSDHAGSPLQADSAGCLRPAARPGGMPV
jgi:hypothetical protein